jgi:predicted thioesterase
MGMDNVKPGLSAELDVEVTAAMTINRTGRDGADVLSTPSLLDLMERCSIKVADPHLPADSVTVGYAVDGLRHLAPTLLGGRLKVRSELTEVNGKRLTFAIEAFEGDKKIGVATHKRAIISPD